MSGKRITWTWHGEGDMMKKVHLDGIYRLEPRGDGTRLVQDVEVKVDIPFVGGQVAKMIGKEFAAGMPKMKEMIEKHLAG